MNRRKFIKGIAAIPFVSIVSSKLYSNNNRSLISKKTLKRVRPGDAGWPSDEGWNKLKMDVGGRLKKLESPFISCQSNANNTQCLEVLKELKNPYYIRDEPALTQSSGWLDAWTSYPSAYAVEAENTNDVVAAVNFARENSLRIVVKGGGHSYQGTSNSKDSLLVYMRPMDDISLTDNFIGKNCEGIQSPSPAVSIGAGAIWMHTYDAVTTKGGRYVQGGGCATVGVAGLISSGGFGSFSKNYGTAAAGLIEAEVVTADGKIKLANACTNQDLFWGIKGGGGGSLGIITRVTLRTRDLPEKFGGVSGSIIAYSDDAFRKLLGKVIEFYRDNLFNPHWGEQIAFQHGNKIRVSMLFQGLNKQEAENIWKPFLDWVKESAQDFSINTPFTIEDLPAQHLWDAAFLKKYAPNEIVEDSRPDAPAGNILWAGDQGQVGEYWHGYKSVWMPESLLKKDNISSLVNALFSATRFWDAGFHFNKGLAGAPEAERTAAKDTAMNPVVVDSFALAIIAGGGPASYPGIPDNDINLIEAREDAKEITNATEQLLKIIPDHGSYLSESDYFEKNWQQAYWGTNYTRLAEVKKKYDPDGLFFVHNGVGSEEWSEDGFVRVD